MCSTHLSMPVTAVFYEDQSSTICSIWHIKEKMFRMKIQKGDRRSQRTRRLLAQALIALLHEQSYEAITVQDLLDRADIGRSTFYAQYYDKDDLLVSEIEGMVDALCSSSATRGTLPIPCYALCQHVQEHERLYHALAQGRGLEHALGAMETSLSRFLATSPSKVPVPATTISLFMAVLRWWVETGMRLAPTQVERLFGEFIMPGLHAITMME